MRRIVVTAVCGVLAAACGGPERTVLDRFFNAARRGDNATMVGMSLVGPPGPVASWEIVAVEEETVEPYRVAELRREVREAERERDEQFQQYNRFRSEHLDELAAIQERLAADPDARLEGRLGEVRDEWERYREENRRLEERLRDLRRRLEREVEIAKKSVLDPSGVERLVGEIAVKRVFVRVRAPDGTERPYTVTLEQYRLAEEEGATPRPARWIITAIDERAG